MSEPYDTGNQRHVQRKARAAKTRDGQLDEAFRKMMGDAGGRALMWERLGNAGVFRTSFAASPELTAFNEGRRDLGLQDLSRIMRLCPEQFTRMQAEALSRDQAASDAAQPKKDDDDGNRTDTDI